MTEYLDADLYASLKKTEATLSDDVALQKLVKFSKNEYDRFVTNQVENPRFKIQSDTFDPQNGERTLTQCHEDLQGSRVAQVVLDLYEAKLKNQQARHRMLAATVREDDLGFTEASIDLYGKPKKQFFSMVAHYCLQLDPQSREAEDALHYLQSHLSHVAKPKQSLPVDILPPMRVEDGVAVDARAVGVIFKQMLTDEGITGWEIVIDMANERTRFAVNPASKEIYIPGDEQLQKRPMPLTVVGAEALAAHEIGVHVKRSHNGAQQPLKLLELGLDGYLRGEEGLASYQQQQIEGARHFYGQDRYLAISVALGLDGEQRDFRSVFSIMVAYYTLLGGDNYDQKRVTKQAWDVCCRIFRGTSGQTAGAVYTKDLVYFEGNVQIWDYVIDHPDRYEHLFIGKFDPLNDRHVNTLQTLELLPQW